MKIEQKVNLLIENGLDIYMGVRKYMDVPGNLLLGIKIHPKIFITENTRGVSQPLKENQIVPLDWNKVAAEYLYVVYHGIAVKMETHEIFFDYIDCNGKTGYVYQTTVVNSPSDKTYFIEEKGLHIYNPLQSLQSAQPRSSVHILNYKR